MFDQLDRYKETEINDTVLYIVVRNHIEDKNIAKDIYKKVGCILMDKYNVEITFVENYDHDDDMIIDKKISHKDLKNYMKREELSYFIYEFLKKCNSYACLDRIINYFSNKYCNENIEDLLYDSHKILKSKYDIDLLSLNFRDKNMKSRLQKNFYEKKLLKHIEDNESKSLKDYSDDLYVKSILKKLNKIELEVQENEDININI